jgi:rod shape-determining protein MreD
MLSLVQRPVVRLIMVGLVLLTIQTTLLTEIRIHGVVADIMLGAAVGAGLVGGAELGALAGFVLGLMYDLVLITPLGLSPLAYGLVAFGFGAAKATITVGSAWWLTMVLVFAGSASGIVLYAVVGSIIGQQGWVQLHLVPEALIVGGVNGLIAVPISRVMKWALRVEREL